MFIPENIPEGRMPGDKKYKRLIVQALKETPPTNNERAFWSLVKSIYSDKPHANCTKHKDRASRVCLRCRRSFVSISKANRVCGSCCAMNSRAPLRESITPFDCGGLFDAQG